MVKKDDWWCLVSLAQIVKATNMGHLVRIKLTTQDVTTISRWPLLNTNLLKTEKKLKKTIQN